MQPDGFGAAQQRLDDYVARVAEIQQRAEETQAQLKSMRTQANSQDGTVSVVLAPGGRLERLTLTPKAMELGHEQLAAVITQTVRQAHNEAANQTQEVLRPLIGESDAMEFLREHVEAAVEDDPAAPAEPETPQQQHDERPPRRDDDGFDDQSFLWKGNR